MHVARRGGVLVHISGDLAQPNVTFISCATQLQFRQPLPTATKTNAGSPPLPLIIITLPELYLQ